MSSSLGNELANSTFTDNTALTGEHFVLLSSYTDFVFSVFVSEYNSGNFTAVLETTFDGKNWMAAKSLGPISANGLTVYRLDNGTEHLGSLARVTITPALVTGGTAKVVARLNYRG